MLLCHNLIFDYLSCHNLIIIFPSHSGSYDDITNITAIRRNCCPQCRDGLYFEQVSPGFREFYCNSCDFNVGTGNTQLIADRDRLSSRSNPTNGKRKSNAPKNGVQKKQSRGMAPFSPQQLSYLNQNLVPLNQNANPISDIM